MGLTSFSFLSESEPGRASSHAALSSSFWLAGTSVRAGKASSLTPKPRGFAIRLSHKSNYRIVSGDTGPLSSFSCLTWKLLVCKIKVSQPWRDPRLWSLPLVVKRGLCRKRCCSLPVHTFISASHSKLFSEVLQFWASLFLFIEGRLLPLTAAKVYAGCHS